MQGFSTVGLLLLSFLALAQSSSNTDLGRVSAQRFEVDYENNQFLKDGKPFRYVAGCLHYFRVPNEYWFDRLSKMRASGVNALETYIEWSSHEPREGEYRFDGDLNITKYLETAKQADLSVVLRIGPYVCAERDLGGLPWWLLKYDLQLRRNNAVYMNYVTKWFAKLLPMLEPYLYRNGGPIITIQIENEYGAYGACDFEYTSKLRDMVHGALGKDVVLFTTDQPNHDGLRCALVDQTLGTIDFGVGTDPKAVFDILRAHRASGPLVNSEYYPGWLDRWGETHQTRATQDVVYWLDKILAYNASVAFYMFHGGTSFGFMSGANFENGKYLPQPTSYDYDAPMDEAGDITDKYTAIKNTIAKYLPIPEMKVPESKPKMSLGPIELKLESAFPQLFSESSWKTVTASTPQAFEYLGARNGIVLYSTRIPFKPTSPSALSIPNLRDRAYVYVDKVYQGTLGRQEGALVLPIRAKKASTLDIVVENQGRVNYGVQISEHKGIFGDVTLGSKVLTNWNHTFLEDWEDFVSGGFHSKVTGSLDSVKSQGLTLTPAVLRNEFVLPENIEPLDTYLNPSNMTKGFAYLNGRCLGRYWPGIGPQVTLYVPGVWLKPSPQKNELILVELEETSCISSGSCFVTFDDKPQIDEPTPEN